MIDLTVSETPALSPRRARWDVTQHVQQELQRVVGWSQRKRDAGDFLRRLNGQSALADQICVMMRQRQTETHFITQTQESI